MSFTTTETLSTILVQKGTEGGDGRVPIELNVFQDLICPFCYIGYKNLIKAITLAKEQNLPIAFMIKYEAFQLDPSLSESEPVLKRQRYREKFGVEQAKFMEVSMIERGKRVGINFNYDGVVRQTTLAQRLIQKAWHSNKHCMQNAVLEKIYRAYFEEAKDIGDVKVLADIAESVGLMTQEESFRFFESDDMLTEVQASIATSRRAKIGGVPFTVVAGGMFGISGAQEPERFYEIFLTLYKKADETGLLDQFKKSTTVA